MNNPIQIAAFNRLIDPSSPAAQEYLRLNPKAMRGVRTRKYSINQLDEAVKHAAAFGLQAAQEATGVSVSSIKKHALALKRRGKDAEQMRREFRGKKYQAKQLTYAIERAIKIYRSTNCTMRAALERAASLTGVNYAYLRVIYSKRLVPFDDNPA